MIDGPLVPGGFAVPRKLITDDFRLEPLGPQHNAADHAAWTGSIAHIRSTPGFAGRAWPPVTGMSPEDNLADLEHHAEEFAERAAFTYTVLAPGSGDVIGCVYLKPPQDAEHDVLVLSWVRADQAHLDAPLHRAVSEWLAADWPFQRADYAPR